MQSGFDQIDLATITLPSIVMRMRYLDLRGIAIRRIQPGFTVASRHKSPQDRVIRSSASSGARFNAPRGFMMLPDPANPRPLRGSTARGETSYSK